MKTMSRIPPLVIFIMIAIAPHTSSAGEVGNVSGMVTSRDGNALLGAVITIFGENRVGGTIAFTRTDSKGAYSLANLTPGSYYLQIARDGYEPVAGTNIRISPGKTTSINVILEEFFAYISKEDDPRNWDLKTVMRSSSDRRLIFRFLPGGIFPDESAGKSAFSRSAVMNVTSSARLSGETYSTSPGYIQGDVTSNFAFTEPVTPHGRIIFSGQLNSGMDSFWRVRDTYNYRPDSNRDYRVSAGYSRQNFSSVAESSMLRPSQFFSQDPSLREGGAESIMAGFEATNRFLDAISLAYGLDFSRVYYGVSKNIYSPYFQIELNPSGPWSLQTSLTSKRLSDSSSVSLPDGEILNLAEPTFVARSGNGIQYSQFRHREISVRRALAENASLLIGYFGDSTQGPGLPFWVTARNRFGRSSQVAQLREDQSGQRGMKVVLNGRILDSLSGSISYIYGTGTSLGNIDSSVATETVKEDLLNFMRQSHYHSFTSQIDAHLPRTNTSLTTVIRWYPGNPLTPTDLFADPMDILTKGVNFRLRQPIPLPELRGVVTRWEALIDVRNLFDQGQESIRTSDGELVINRNPRSLRFGFNLNFD
jgi:hypothetical protein